MSNQFSTELKSYSTTHFNYFFWSARSEFALEIDYNLKWRYLILRDMILKSVGKKKMHNFFANCYIAVQKEEESVSKPTVYLYFFNRNVV